MLTDLAVNLLAALIGFFVAQAHSYLKPVFSKRTKWFWVPVPSAKIFLHYGGWRDLLSDAGELEPVVNVKDALTLGELRMFLKLYYPEIVVTTDKNSIDWQYPVISIGGPLPNPLTREIGERGLLPIWFLDMPYSQQATRVIGSAGRAEMFRSEFDETGRLVTDVGTVARLKSPEHKQQFLYVIAGNYDIGTLGVVKFLTSVRKLVQLRKMNGHQCFQAVIRSRVSEGRIIDTTLVHYRELD